MPHYKRFALIVAAAALSLAGCHTPKHTDLLVFGTNTQFGVSVAADATSNPGVNIGFKRQELVLMPLYVNGTQSKFGPPGASGYKVADTKYIASDGNAHPKTDTYSVLASFGARGEGDSAGKAEVGIAQYFATGLAARTLAYAGGALINTSDSAAANSPGTAAAAAAAETDGVTNSLIIASNRFSAEGEILDAFAKLTPAQKTSFVAKLNHGTKRSGANSVTSDNLQQQLATMSEAEIAYARQLAKNP